MKLADSSNLFFIFVLNINIDADMKLFRIIVLLLLLLPSTLSTLAQNGKIEYTSSSFVLEGRKITIRGADLELTNKIAEKLAYNGAMVAYGVMSKIFLPSITLSEVKEIDDVDNAFNIKVTNSLVTIKYTSQKNLDLALVELYEMFDVAYGKRIIRGGAIAYRGEQIKTRSVLYRNSEGVYDGVSSLVAISKIENAINKHFAENSDKKFIIALSNNQKFRAQFENLRGLNPQQSLMAENIYSTTQIRELVSYARSRGGEFIPAIDLLSQSPAFELYTGHKIDSVEGMRFVRVIIEEAANEWGVKELCVGRLTNGQVKPYYIDFIKDIAQRNSINLILL